MKRFIRLGGERDPIGGGLRPLVTVEVRNRRGDYTPVRFCIDTGADICSIPISFAEQHGLPFPRDAASRSNVVGLVGSVAQYRGFIHVRLFDEEFDWPCGFLDSARVFEYGVIGRIGFAASFNACLEFPYCVVERRLAHLPWWRRFAARLFSRSRVVRFNDSL